MDTPIMFGMPQSDAKLVVPIIENNLLNGANGYNPQATVDPALPMLAGSVEFNLLPSRYQLASQSLW